MTVKLQASFPKSFRFSCATRNSDGIPEQQPEFAIHETKITDKIIKYINIVQLSLSCFVLTELVVQM